MSSNKKIATIKKILPPSSQAFKCRQIDIFQDFLYNTPEQLENLSNAIPLWDCLPRYSLSRQAADRLRKKGQLPPLLKLRCQYLGQWFSVEIQPARISDDNGGITEYYPSATEELVEDALRRISTLQNHGFFEDGSPKTRRSGVSFTIYQLREELKKQGHSRSYQEIILSLKILARSFIQIKTESDEGSAFTISPYFTHMSAVSQKDFKTDPRAQWFVEFHPLITQAISTINYRQYNYSLMMRHSTQLARWIHKYLVLKFTFAQVGKKFELRFSTIKRDSGLLESYQRSRDAISDTRSALDELKNHKVLTSISEEKIFGDKGKIEDIVFSLYPSPVFVAEAKAANKKINEAKKSLILNSDSPRTRRVI